MPAWLLSVLLHGVFVAAAAVMVPVVYQGAAEEADRQGGIVLVDRQQGEDLYVDASSSAARRAAMAEADAQLPPVAEAPPQVDATLPALPTQPPGGQPGDLGQLNADAQGFLQGKSPSKRLRGQEVTTRVFGVEGTGNRFIYVFDRSASMEGFQGRPLAAAKAQLLASLQDLESTHQFQVIFYNNRPSVFNPFYPNSPRLLSGTDTTKRQAEQFIRGIVGAGGTRHMEALRMALGMQPDVVFFLTDAAEPRLSPGELAEIQRSNRAIGASIHAIEFGAGPSQGGSNFLTELAGQNGGQHQYVDISRLRL